MTRFVGEPSPEKKFSQQRASIESLARRPSPSTAPASVATMRSYGGETLTFGNSPTLVYICDDNYGSDFQQQGGYELDNTYGIYLPGNGNGVYLVNVLAWESGSSYNTTRDWSIGFERFTDLTSAMPINALESLAGLPVDSYSTATFGRKNTIQLIDHFTVFPASVYSASATRVGFAPSIGIATTIPGDSVSWTISYKVMITRLGDYYPDA